MNEMSDPTMPAGLAALLSEPGWERSKYGPVWRLWLDAEHGETCIHIEVQEGRAVATLQADGFNILYPEDLAAAAKVFGRIQAALAQEDPA